MKKLSLIRATARAVTDSELTALRLEEELLLNLIQKSGESVETKKLAFVRMEEINRRQIQIVGGVLK